MLLKSSDAMNYYVWSYGPILYSACRTPLPNTSYKSARHMTGNP
jgi:hypothetical protein